MYPINTKNQCSIYDSSFLSDLKDHTIEDVLYDPRLQSNTQTSYLSKLSYKNSSSSSDIQLKTTEMRSFLSAYTPATSSYNWLPAIISHDNYVQNKEVLAGNVVGNKVLGIENFASVQQPWFKHWQILDNNNVPTNDGVVMSVDWFVNSNTTSIEPEYGVLYWYKQNNTLNTNTTQYSLSQLPRLTVVSPTANIVNNDTNSTVLATPSDRLIKLNDTTLKFIDKSPVNWTGVIDPEFNYGTKDQQNTSRSTIDISTAKNSSDIRFYATYSQNFLNSDQNLLFPDYQIWVSDGEFYSYYNNNREKTDFRTNRRIPSRSYLSPGLYHIYRAIYNAFTVDRVRNNTTIGTVCYAEKLKKLCSILATSPLIDRVTINCLYNEDIRTNINTYLNASAPSSTTDEIRELVNIISLITAKLSNLTDKIDNQNIRNNYIRTPGQLYKKLITKYAANLRIENSKIRKVKFTSSLPNGPHAYFDINHKIFCSKTLVPTTDRIKAYVYNKFEYKVGDIIIKNSVDSGNNTLKSQSLRIYSDTNPAQKIDIPWDILVEPKSEKLRINLGKDIVLPFTPDANGEMKISYDLTLPDDIDVFWQLIDGPECFRFSNYAKNGRIDFLKRNRTSYDARPDFYIKKPGLYTVQCQVTKSSILKASDYIRLYIGSADTSVPARTTEDSNDLITQKYNAICSNLRQFALNKNGLVWIVDSDIYNIAQTNQEIITDSTTSSRLLNRKIGLGFPAQIASNAEFSIQFETLNTVVKLHSVSIEHMRDGTQKTAQCKSFYQDKIVRQRDRVFGIDTRAARYFRQDRSPSAITFYGRGYDDNGQEKQFYQEYNFPLISTVLAPDIKSYGGYANSVINQIGVEIPFHPVYEGSSFRRLSVKKLPNGFWGDGPNPKNPLVAKNPLVMERLITHNPMGGNDPSFRCNMMDIPISGSVTLNKGFFHPNSGWYPASTSFTYPSIVNNIGSSAYSSLSSHGVNSTAVHRYKLARYKSLYFTGNGIFDMRGMTVGTNTSYNTYMSRILLKNGSDTGAYFYEHALFHGYRNINGISYKAQENIDDLYIERCVDNEIEDSFICDPVINSDISNNCYPGIATSMYSFPPNILNNLTIEDLEIKINFINYPNPKNMIIALEIFNDTLPTAPDFNTIFISNNKQATSVTELNTYWSKLTETNTNTSTTSPSRIIYLYNQESLDNYNYNFSLLFSDHHNHHAVFDDYNKYDKYIGSHNDPIHSNQPIGPTLSADNYSDRDSAKYKKAIKNNLLPVSASSLAKFKNIPLLNTSFILKVIILGPEEKILSMDNVVNNSELSGLSSFELSRTSNTIANSICSWDLIVHTTKTPKFNNKNPRGHIDYNNSSDSIINGYNFMGDFTDKTYLIPKVNMNAPYEYLANINYYCRYINDDELSRPLSYQEIKFPFVFYSFTPFFTLVGAMFAAWELAQAFSRGGRSDPIINMLYDIKFQQMQQELERNYFQPGYEAVAQGYADKAVVSLTKDDITWYKMEVPINRYEHSDILKLKRYNYLKLSPEIAKPLSLFKFDLVVEDKDLAGTGEIKHVFDTNIARVGLTIAITDPTDSNQTINLKFDEGDIVELAGQTTATDNGLYVVKTGAWSRFPDTANIQFLIRNKYYNNNNTNNITTTDITAKQIIKIKGSRAANFFDINESVSLSSNTDRENPISRTITDKYVINITNSLYTILVLSAPLTALSSGYIYKNTNNVLLVYADTETVGDDSTIGKWGLSKSTEELGNKLATKIQHSALGEGNYGYGTPYVNPSVYASLSYDTNNLDQIYNMLNNNVNDRYKYNKIFLESNGTTTTIDFNPNTDSASSLCKAYPFTINDYGYAKDTAGYEQFLTDDISEEDKANIVIDMVGSIIQPDRQNYYFMDLKSDKFTSVAASGYLYIENDYVRYKPTQKLSVSQKTDIENRIKFISVTGVPSSNLSNTSISYIDNIPDLLTVYNNTTEAANVCQYPNFNNTGTSCKKQQAKLKLLSLCDERSKLLKILENDDRASANVLPVQEIVYKTIPQTGQAGVPPKVIIEYKTKDYFWFNIDPNQTCSRADEAMPRILYETEYSCSPIVEYYQYPECDSVCSYTTANGADFEFKSASGGGTVCINKRVAEEKQLYPQVSEWDTDVATGHDYVTKKFFLSCEDNMRDTLLTIKEKYLYPKVANLERSGLVKDIFNLDDTDSIKMKFRIIPRKLKTIDPIYQRYVYDYYGNVGKDLIPAPGGAMYNGLSVWRCIDTNSASPNYGKMIDPPAFFKLQNEMIFRAYFGSVDGIEIKNSPISEAKEFWEWIPYEYFDGPVID